MPNMTYIWGSSQGIKELKNSRGYYHEENYTLFYVWDSF